MNTQKTVTEILYPKVYNKELKTKYISALLTELTAYDRRYNKNNIYALGHYLKSISNIEHTLTTYENYIPKYFKQTLFNITTQNFIYENDKFQIPAVEKTVNKFNLNYTRNEKETKK